MIDGIWWLVILLVVVIALWLIARSRANNHDNQNNAKTVSNDALQQTVAVIKQHFPEYRVIRRESHLMLTKNGEKIAMITIDKGMGVGKRLLGDVPIINYHRVPNKAQLSSSLHNTAL